MVVVVASWFLVVVLNPRVLSHSFEKVSKGKMLKNVSHNRFGLTATESNLVGFKPVGNWL